MLLLDNIIDIFFLATYNTTILSLTFFIDRLLSGRYRICYRTTSAMTCDAVIWHTYIVYSYSRYWCYVHFYLRFEWRTNRNAPLFSIVQIELFFCCILSTIALYDMMVYTRINMNGDRAQSTKLEIYLFYRVAVKYSPWLLLTNALKIKCN